MLYDVPILTVEIFLLILVILGLIRDGFFPLMKYQYFNRSGEMDVFFGLSFSDLWIFVDFEKNSFSPQTRRCEA